MDLPARLKGLEAASAHWPPQPASQNRLCGFYTDGVIDSAQDAAAFAVQFFEHQNDMAAEGSPDRLSFRVVAHAGALSLLDAQGVTVEGALPLSYTEPNLVVAYTAANLPGRTMSDAQLARHHGLLVEAKSRTPKDARCPAAEPRLLTPEDVDSVAADFAKLYMVFSPSTMSGIKRALASAYELLGDPNNTVAYIEQDGHIVSTAMAEHSAVDVAGLGKLELVEITEASTHPAYRGLGLYKRVSGYLIERLRHGQPNLVYGESNLAQPGVVFAAHDNGRRFAHFEAAEYSMGHRPAFGILQQNFHVADGVETRPYNDFAISYVPSM
ncbi:MAG TPA: GNAT family N-acetyltransferase [Candidatus Saccharimonadales bacterium]|nr:GNAT family N-acetyltransferase [Candidatus Saccharimonadales bacterium]